jgi:hypothetical protein
MGTGGPCEGRCSSAASRRTDQQHFCRQLVTDRYLEEAVGGGVAACEKASVLADDPGTVRATKVVIGGEDETRKSPAYVKCLRDEIGGFLLLTGIVPELLLENPGFAPEAGVRRNSRGREAKLHRQSLTLLGRRYAWLVTRSSKRGLPGATWSFGATRTETFSRIRFTRFFGSAAFNQAPGQPASWSGSLAVELPAAGIVPLAGPAFATALCRGTGELEQKPCTDPLAA